ncbi:MAG: hypothetical protein AAFV85_26900 [Cyanobacteria bacterium J06634_6]
MAVVPYTSTNQTGSTIFFQRHSQSGEGDDAADAVVGVIGLVDSAGNEVGSTNPLPTATQTKTVLFATGTVSAVGDAIAIDISAAPGYTSGDKIVITALRIQNENGTANTVTLKDAATTIARVYTEAAGSGLDRVYAPGREMRLGADNDFILNLSAANAVGYSIEYFLEA